MSTNIDLTIGVNLKIGSVPVSLSADVATTDTETVYTFNGCVQDAVIDIGSFVSFVGQQFGVSVQLPPELNLEAEIDYVAGQVIYTKPVTGDTTTEMGVSAKFDLVYTNGGDTTAYTFTFYADSIISSADSTKSYIVGGSIDTNLEFSSLPLVGTIPVFNEFILKHIGFSYTNLDPSSGTVNFNIPQVSTSDNPLYTMNSADGKMKTNYTINSSGEQTTFGLNQKGFALTAGLMTAGSNLSQSNFSLPMDLPAASTSEYPATYYQSSGTVQSSPPGSPINWISVNKTFGPIDLQQIGLNYKSGELTFGFSAGFSMGGFSLGLQGLSITFPLPLPGMPSGDKLSFDLEGLSMAYQKSGLSIGGAFLKSVDTETNITSYYGQAVVQMNNYGLKAIGGYSPAQNNNPASFFIYANLAIPMGGPPFLYVSGLAFGFGVNYALNLPTTATLPYCLLLPANAPTQPANAKDAFSTVLPQLASGKNPLVTNEAGEYWVAAGVQFTSFNMVSAFALVTFSFGVDVQIGLLGSASITLPKGAASPLAYFEIDLVASFTPSSGELAVNGMISPASYIFADYVSISGGFAFYTWFSGEHKGDFVVTLGGYNSAYNKPSWYPTVSRITLSYVVDSFRASGTAYLALTPAMFMAGFQCTASFSSGPVRAWFSAGFNFIIEWAPFSYSADAYVNVGCSVDMGLFTVSASIGADVKVWGPAFGGKAHIDLDVVSFTISFGSSSPNPVPVTWTNIEEDFLPGSATTSTKARSLGMARMLKAASLKAEADETNGNVSASVSAGLQQQDVVDASGNTWNWILDPNDFVIVTATTIPANLAHWSNTASSSITIPNVLPIDSSDLPSLSLSDDSSTYSETEIWNPDLYVKPMKLSNVQSVHTITLLKSDENGDFTSYVTEVNVQPVLANAPTALWSDPSVATTVNTDSLIACTLAGFNISAMTRNPDTVNAVPLFQLLFTPGNETTFSYTSAQPDDSYTVTSSVTLPDYDLDIEVSGDSTQSFVNEDYILSTLTNDWVTGQRNTILDDLTANGFSTYTSSEIDLTAMATTEELTDWPQVSILGKVA